MRTTFLTGLRIDSQTTRESSNWKVGLLIWKTVQLFSIAILKLENAFASFQKLLDKWNGGFDGFKRPIPIVEDVFTFAKASLHLSGRFLSLRKRHSICRDGFPVFKSVIPFVGMDLLF